jgi:N-acetylglucosamine kinase-like BadF-type ATPase
VTVAGTGSAVLSADISTGFCKSYGNWDFMLGDDGSGFAIGRAALQETLRYAEGRSAARTIAQLCLEHLGLTDPQEIPDAVHAHISDKAVMASLAEPVLKLATHGVPEALAIVSRQAGLLAEITIFAYDELPSRDPVIGCFGGIFRNATFLTEFQKAVSNNNCRRPTPVASNGLPLSGAFRLLLNASGGSAQSEKFRKSTARFDEMLLEHQPK